MTANIIKLPSPVAMALTVCLLGGPAVADPPKEDMAPAALPHKPCLETASQLDAALARLDESLQKYGDKHPDVVAERERVKADEPLRKALLQKCLDGDVTANRMLYHHLTAIMFLVSVVDPDKCQSGAIRGSAGATTREIQGAQLAERLKSQRCNELLHANPGILNQAQVIILVRVVKRDPAKLLVLKSWQGPFPAGRVLQLHVDKVSLSPGNVVSAIAGETLWQQALQAHEALIFTKTGPPDAPDTIFRGRAWAGSDPQAQSLIQALDQAMKETQEQQAPHPEASP